MAMKSIFDDELILPGVITEIVNDYIAGYDTSEFGTTDAVTIIGTAFNGPVGVPVPVFSPEYAKYMFGEAFDSVNRIEATLVPEIYDAWERGCRTIYAVRVSGKEMFKDFELAKECNYMLRVSGQFPCNANKDCFMVFDSDQGNGSAVGSIKVYKPADRTTVQEKLQGVVNNVNSILVSELNLDANGIHKDTRIIDLINKVNEMENNNVLTLSIVDREGLVMTEANKEINHINVGDMFPGIYTICRDKVGADVIPKTSIDIIVSENHICYQGFKDAIWKKLDINTDVKQPYPLFADNMDDFRKSISENLIIDENFEFIKKVGFIDRLAVKNDIDYEEAVLDPFDLYCRLGKGFVKQAKLEKVTKAGSDKVYYKVVQPASDDPQRIIGINDGIYSVLEGHKSDYLVLAGVSAETEIKNSLPRKNDFLVARAKDINLLDMSGADTETVIKAACVVDPKDFSIPVNYDITVKDVVEFNMEGILEQDVIIKNLHPGKFLRMPVIDLEDVKEKRIFEGVEHDLLVLAIDGSDVNSLYNEGQLARFNAEEGIFVEVNEDLLGIGQDNDYVSPKLLVEISEKLEVFKHIGAGAYKLDKNPLDLEENEDGVVESKPGYIIASNGAIANVYYVPGVDAGEEGDDSYNSLINALRDSSGIVLTDDDNADGDYDQGIDCILTYRLAKDSITPLISLKDLAEKKLEEEDFTVYCIEKDMPCLPAGQISNNATFIGVFSNEVMFCSRQEMCDMFNAEDRLNDRFQFSVTNSSRSADELPGHINGAGLNKEEALVYDELGYIMYSTDDNFARHLAQHCLYTQLKTYPTHGVIGCSKLGGINLSTIGQRVDEICNFEFDLFAKKDNGNYMLDSDNQAYPLGRCLSIVFTQYAVGTGSSYNYISNGAAGYAGMVSCLPVERSSTNQAFNIDKLNFELSNYQLGRLNAKGIVCAKNTTGGNVVIVDGITQAPKTSAYRRLSTSRTINAVDKVLRTAIEPYIGLVDSLTTRNSMNTSIKSALTTLTGIIINDFKFKIYTDASGGNLGVIRVDYVIVPFNEIREVRNRVEISDAI